MIKQLFVMCSLGAVTSLYSAETVCAKKSGCAKKICEVEHQIKISTEKGNIGKVKGLKKVLSNLKDNCTDKGLMKKYQAKLAGVNEDFKEHKSDFDAATKDGDTKKICKYKNKMNEDLVEIKDLEKCISELTGAVKVQK